MALQEEGSSFRHQMYTHTHTHLSHKRGGEEGGVGGGHVTYNGCQKGLTLLLPSKITLIAAVANTNASDGPNLVRRLFLFVLEYLL